MIQSYLEKKEMETDKIVVTKSRSVGSDENVDGTCVMMDMLSNINR
jgi:hypothetical protein